MILDLLTLGQDAVVRLLREQLPEEQRGLVLTVVPEDARPPFHLVGEIDAGNDGGKDEQEERLTVDVHTVYEGDDRRELLALMFPVKAAAWDATLVVDGVRFRFGWLASAASTAASNGVTYAGLTTIEIFAEPA